jgi:cytochrome c553
MNKSILAILAIATIAIWNTSAADAKENWTKYCKGCHGVEGKGDTTLGQKLKCRDYSDPKVQESVKDEDIFKAIKEGYPKGNMKPLGDKLSDDEIKELVKYLRSLKKK